MASTLITKQSSPSALTPTDLYTVPASTKTVISRIIVCNRSAVPVSFRVSVSVGGGATADKDYLSYDEVVPANLPVSVAKGITLNATDKVRVYAGTADLSFNLFGEEIT